MRNSSQLLCGLCGLCAAACSSTVTASMQRAQQRGKLGRAHPALTRCALQDNGRGSRGMEQQGRWQLHESGLEQEEATLL